MPSLLPPDTPDEVVKRAARGPRVPVFDPRVGRGAVPATGGARHRLVALGGVASLLCFSPILWALVSEPWTGVRWWRAIPLGGVERLLGVAEVVAALLLAWWAVRAPRSRS